LEYFTEICHDIFKNDENTFELFIKEWFRHGTQRLKRDIGNSYKLNFVLGNYLQIETFADRNTSNQNNKN